MPVKRRQPTHSQRAGHRRYAANRKGQARPAENAINGRCRGGIVLPVPFTLSCIATLMTAAAVGSRPCQLLLRRQHHRKCN